MELVQYSTESVRRGIESDFELVRGEVVDVDKGSSGVVDFVVGWTACDPEVEVGEVCRGFGICHGGPSMHFDKDQWKSRVEGIERATPKTMEEFT